jgi:hypothetical protein
MGLPYHTEVLCFKKTSIWYNIAGLSFDSQSMSNLRCNYPLEQYNFFAILKFNVVEELKSGISVPFAGND